MSITQKSSRYSSTGNSGYDDDFDADADELDAELDLEQGSDDDGAGADAAERSENDLYGSDDPEGDAGSPGPSSRRSHDGPQGEEELPHEGSLVLGGQSSTSQSGGTPGPSEAASPPVPGHPTSHRPGRPEDAAGSPASPHPPLPPLSLTVSPYLVRASGASHTSAAASAAPAAAATSSTAPAAAAANPSLAPPSRAPPAYPAPGASPSVPAAHHASSRGSGSSGRHKHAAPTLGPGVEFVNNASQLLQPHWQEDQRLGSRGGAVPALALTLLTQAGSQGAEQQQQQLAAAIRESVDALRTSEHVRQLQAAVEALTAQLLAAERGRSAAEAALVELTQRMQEQEKRLNESWEAKLLEKQREVQQMRTKVQQLESQGIKGRLTAASSSATTRGSQQGVGVGGGITPEEAATLRKELEQTEVLIRGYQQENEAATRRIKELEESLAAAESRTAEEVLRTERAVLLARDDAGRRNAETATKLARVLALEKELAGVRDEAQTREAELKAQLEKTRAEKKALEARAGGVDLKAMADGDVLVKQLREEMDAGRQATQTLVQEMQAKLAWYAENQELLNKNDSLVAEQRETIQQLQARLVQYEGPGAKGSAANRVAAAQARVRELEAQVEQLNKTLRSRAPGNSLAAVVAAARPSAEETQLVSELRGQVEELEDTLRRKDEEFELQLRSYQQQFEKLKAQYSERASRLDAVSKVRGRVKELERQLEEQKSIFRRRVQELEGRLKGAQDHGAVIPPTPTAVASHYSSSTLQTPTKGQQHHQQPQAPGSAAARRDDLVPASYLRARELEVKKLTIELERRSKQVSELHLKLGEAESRNVRLAADLRRAQQSSSGIQSPLSSRLRGDGVPHDERPVGSSRGARQHLEPYPPDSRSDEDKDGASAAAVRQGSAELLERLEARCSNLTVENGNLRGQVQALTQQLAVMRRDLEEARAAAAATPAASQGAAADLRRKLEAAELALVTVQRSATEAVERGALAAAEHQRAMLRLHDEVAYKEGLKWQERLATLEQELRVAQQRCEQMEAELAVARSRGAGAWSPEASAFAAMERRLDDMARDMAAREAKWRAVLKDTQSMHGVQADVQRRKWESLLATKEAEVQATRAELQSLLQEVAQVQELQTRLVAKQQRQAAKF
ncbi:hypothetical protein PLESTB_000227900 [Pleodorina starrii]|uniref:Centrosomal protein of 162 kDa n=1 Tax=Pleodorina starrii TaxID=330485 RepID=A0A9W6BCJ7_9CHLO|nr:hypothetical protein PLESTM_001017200 [Pleodorina starrii]GLC49518.1 hypothetical protein PLESTB_000227900 [Pleodorina starrii]